MALTYKKISLEEANKLYKLEEQYEIPIHLCDEDEPILIFDQDVIIDGNFELNEHKEFDSAYGGGYIILGNLIVNGNIIDSDIDFGPFLIVMGNAKAHNISLGGSHVYIKGNLTVKNLMYFEYNHGTFHVKGITQAKIIISSDHHTHLDNIQKGILVDDISHGSFSKKPDYTNKNMNQLFIKEVFNEKGYFKGSDLWNLLLENKNYLQPHIKTETIDW